MRRRLHCPAVGRAAPLPLVAAGWAAPLLLAAAGWAAPLLLAAAGCARPVDPAYVREIDAWHAGRLEGLKSESGWLTLVGRHELRPGANTLGSAEGVDVRLTAAAPARLGTLTLGPEGIVFAPEPGVAVFPAGHPESPLAGPVPVRTDAGEDATLLATGTLTFHVIERGEQWYLRVKDSYSEVRRNFTGIDRFPVDPRRRVTARLERQDPARTIAITNALGQVSEESSPGTLVFELDGQRCSLVPTGDPAEGLFIVFADGTTGRTTYGGGRFLSTEPPAPDGTVVLDFNKAVNPPCVFTPYATCPLPPAENRLRPAIEAGEKTWGRGH